MSSKRLLFALLLLLALIACLVGIGLSIYYFNSRVPLKDYAVMFDAGPTKTKMNVYEWNADFKPNKSIGLVLRGIGECVIEDLIIDKIKGGKDELQKKFARCLEAAHSLVPEDRKSRTKLNLIATAALRLASSGVTPTNVLNIVREFFSSSGFLFSDPNQVKTIDANQEAMNAWISANYLAENFDKPDSFNNTQGILDLGSSIAQMTFVPQNIDPRRAKVTNLFGKNYPIYSQSFLCYGSDEAQQMYLSNTVRVNNFNSLSTAHCNPTGSNVYLTRHDLAKSSCANGNIFNEPYPSVYLQKDYNLIGDSNFKYCIDDVRQLFNKNKPCSIDNDACSFRNVFIPNVKNNKFLAQSTLWKALNNTNKLLNKSINVDMDAFKQASSHICSMNLNELTRYNEAHQAGFDKNQLIRLCFQNVYIIELLTQFGFDSFENIKFAENVNGKNTDWTQGHLINEINTNENYLPIENIPRKLPLLWFTILVVGLSLLAIVMVLGLLYVLFMKQDD